MEHILRCRLFPLPHYFQNCVGSQWHVTHSHLQHLGKVAWVTSSICYFHNKQIITYAFIAKCPLWIKALSVPLSKCYFQQWKEYKSLAKHFCHLTSTYLQFYSFSTTCTGTWSRWGHSEYSLLCKMCWTAMVITSLVIIPPFCHFNMPLVLHRKLCFSVIFMGILSCLQLLCSSD